MSGKRPSAWIRIRRSLKWPSHTCSATAPQTTAEPPAIPPPLPVRTTPASEAGDPALLAPQAIAGPPPNPRPLTVLAAPAFDFGGVDPGLGAEQALAWLSRNRSPNAANAMAELPQIESLAPVEADPDFDFETVERAEVPAPAVSELPPIAPPLAEEIEVNFASEAAEAAEVAASLQNSRPTTDFALPARLAAVAKLNVASARRPQHRPYHLPPGKAVPLASNAHSAYVRRRVRLEAMKPATRVIIQERTALAPAVVIDLEAVRKAVQNIPIAKHAA